MDRDILGWPRHPRPSKMFHSYCADLCGFVWEFFRPGPQMVCHGSVPKSYVYSEKDDTAVQWWMGFYELMFVVKNNVVSVCQGGSSDF